MRLSRFPPFVSLSVVGLGVVLTILLAGMEYIHALLLGIPLTSMGLWMFTRVEDARVCLNCGARNDAAEQPAPAADLPVESAPATPTEGSEAPEPSE